MRNPSQYHPYKVDRYRGGAVSLLINQPTSLGQLTGTIAHSAPGTVGIPVHRLTEKSSKGPI
jgi:hypothetical protein